MHIACSPVIPPVTVPLLYVAVRQVLASYGYLDRVEHGPAFVSELLDAVLRYLVGATPRRTRPPGAGALAAAGAGPGEAQGLPVELLQEGSTEDEAGLDRLRHQHQQDMEGYHGWDVGGVSGRDQGLGARGVQVGGAGCSGEEGAGEVSSGPSVARPRSQGPLARVGQHDPGVTGRRRVGVHHRTPASTGGRKTGRLKEAPPSLQVAEAKAQAKEPVDAVATLAAASRGAPTAGELPAPDSTRATGAAGAVPQPMLTKPSGATSLSAVSVTARREVEDTVAAYLQAQLHGGWRRGGVRPLCGLMRLGVHVGGGKWGVRDTSS